MPAWVGTNATVTAADGPSGMQDACRVGDADVVNAGYATSGAAVLAGATNVPFIYNCWTKAWPGGGLNAVFQSYYTGDGGGPELFTNWTIVGAVPGAWRPFAGLAHTPVGAAHTAVVTRLIPTDNVGASVGSVLFAEVWGVQNSNVDRLAWRRVAAGAAAATTTPSFQIVNTNNYVYNPLRGSVKLTIGGFQGTAGATFLQFGAAGAAGSLTLDYNAGQLRLRIWNAAGALAVTVNGGAVNANRHEFSAVWDSQVGYAALLERNVALNQWTALGTWAGAWTSAPGAVTPLHYFTDAAGANPARCFVEVA
jgi:hypothetical protein